MTDRELMQKAMEMIGQLKPDNWHDRDRQGQVWDALRERLAQPLVSSDGTSTWIDVPQRPVTPQEMQPCAGRNCGSTNPNLHSAECFEDYDKATGMNQWQGLTCPECEYHKQRSQLWRHEAYKHGGHPLDWEPELMVRPRPLADEEIISVAKQTHSAEPGREGYILPILFARAIEAAHGIGGEK